MTSPTKVTTGKTFDGHYQPVSKGQILMTVKEVGVGRKKFDIHEMPDCEKSLILIKKKGNPFDSKNQENGLEKNDLQIDGIQCLEDVTPEQANEQFDANTIDVQKRYDAHGESYKAFNDDTEAVVNDKTDEDYSALKSAWKSNLGKKMLQYAAVTATKSFINVLVQSSFPNEL